LKELAAYVNQQQGELQTLPQSKFR
jgi:hypothetical protein